MASLSASDKTGATVTVLGPVSSSTTLSLGNTGLSGQFSDAYLFTIPAGNVFDFSAWLSTGFSNRFGIEDFEGNLFDLSGWVASGVSTTRYMPFPSFDVSFPSMVLGEGEYTLQLAGRAYHAYELGTASYDGMAVFRDANSPVPEPGTLMLAGLALVGLGIAGYRKPASRMH